VYNIRNYYGRLSNFLDTSSIEPQSNNLNVFARTIADMQFKKKDQAIVFNIIEDAPSSRIHNNSFSYYSK